MTDTTILYPVIGWPDLPHLCKCHHLLEIRLTQKEALWGKSISEGACPCLPPTIVLRHIVVLRHSPLLQLLSNVV